MLWEDMGEKMNMFNDTVDCKRVPVTTESGNKVLLSIEHYLIPNPVSFRDNTYYTIVAEMSVEKNLIDNQEHVAKELHQALTIIDNATTHQLIRARRVIRKQNSRKKIQFI